MPGPPKKPTALKLLEGNPGKQKLNAHEPKPPVKLPAVPKHLSADAKRLWRRIGPRFAAMGVVAEADELAFAILCESYAAWCHLIDKAREHGPIVKMNGQMVPNPYLTRADREAEKTRKLLAEFGGSPAARARLTVDGQPSTPADEVESFLRLAQ
jgi:P27 family predicted phage terminase small subunit